MVFKQAERSLLNTAHAIVFGSVTAMATFALTACGGGGSPEQSTDDAQLEVASSAILNGTASTWAPGIVAVLSTFPGLGTLKCSGTFITRFDVLTAGHCLYEQGRTPSKVEIVFGASWSGTKRRAQRYAHHPDWARNPVVSNDIGVVSFDQPIAPSDAAIEYATDIASGALEGRQVLTVGYGANHADQRTGAGAKRWAWTFVVDNSDEELDLRSSGTTTCEGDSGGPVLDAPGGVWRVVGVISGGTGCRANTTSYAAMTSAHVDFIEEHTTINQ